MTGVWISDKNRKKRNKKLLNKWKHSTLILLASGYLVWPSLHRLCSTCSDKEIKEKHSTLIFNNSSLIVFSSLQPPSTLSPQPLSTISPKVLSCLQLEAGVKGKDEHLYFFAPLKIKCNQPYCHTKQRLGTICPSEQLVQCAAYSSLDHEFFTNCF